MNWTEQKELVLLPGKTGFARVRTGDHLWASMKIHILLDRCDNQLHHETVERALNWKSWYVCEFLGKSRTQQDPAAVIETPKTKALPPNVQEKDTNYAIKGEGGGEWFIRRQERADIRKPRLGIWRDIYIPLKNIECGMPQAGTCGSPPTASESGKVPGNEQFKLWNSSSITRLDCEPIQRAAAYWFVDDGDCFELHQNLISLNVTYSQLKDCAIKTLSSA